MRIVVLADIHGNLPALHAVLADLAAEPVAAIVIAGDVVGGAYPREVLELLGERRERVLWISGNAERETVAAWDGGPTEDDEPGRAAAWGAQALDRRWRDRLASWPIKLALDDVCICHGSPRRDDEILTRATPDAVLREAFAGVSEPLVVGGHTHQQTIRTLSNAPDYVNAGSVGMPYEGRAGAYWLLLDDGRPQLRETAYDIEGAVAELRASGFPDVESQIGESLLVPVDADWVTAFFEHAAGRGHDPGPPPTEGRSAT